MQEPYYMAYEKRYQAAYSAGAARWGHSHGDEVLRSVLENWVAEQNLKGKKILEFACGEGACGVILAELGCVYHGVDISPSAIGKSGKLLEKYPDASVEILDMVREQVSGEYDAALDCMGLHMLITDEDRRNYLKNAYSALKDDAPMLFFRESYRRTGTYSGTVHSVEQWKRITGEDYETPQWRQVQDPESGRTVEVLIPLLPARAKDRTGYTAEMERAGFCVERFEEMESSSAIAYSASIYVRKTEKRN